MKSKICGVSDSKSLEYLTNHSHPPDFIGFIVNYPKSKRYIEINKLSDLLKTEKKHSLYVAVLVKPDNKIPGFKKIIIDPLIIPSLLPLSFQHQSIHGDIKVDIKIENKKATMLIDIPNGIMGELRLKKYHNIKINNITQENKMNELHPGLNTIKFDV